MPFGKFGVVKDIFECLRLFNTYSMKQPDLYYFETIKMTSQTSSNFVWRIRVAGQYSLRTLTRLVTSCLCFQNSIDQAVS